MTALYIGAAILLTLFAIVVLAAIVVNKADEQASETD